MEARCRAGRGFLLAWAGLGWAGLGWAGRRTSRVRLLVLVWCGVAVGWAAAAVDQKHETCYDWLRGIFGLVFGALNFSLIGFLIVGRINQRIFI